MAASRLPLILSLLLAGCAAQQQARAPAQSPAPVAASGWQAFSDRFVSGYLEHFPTFAVYQGKHEFDGRLPDWSGAGFASTIAFLESARTEAQRFPNAGLTPEERFEREYLVAQADRDLFWLKEADNPHRNPAYYVDNGLDPNVYVARPYAAPEIRLRALTRFARNIPAAAAQIRANLRTPLPLSFIEFGKAAFGGFADYYTGDAKAAFATVKDPQLQADYDAAAKAASAAMRDLASWLESQRPTATQGFALGAKRFQHMVWATERVDTPVAKLEAIGRADMKRNQDALKAACASLLPGGTIEACVAKVNANKPAGSVVEEARRQLGTLRTFVTEHDIVSIPGTEQALVEESPPYNRQNSAYIDLPGPYEQGLPSVYYISPPDPAWSKEVQEGFIPGKADLLFTSVHEVWPGHFLNFLHSNRSKFLFGRLFVGYAFAEGYAHYAEEMMWDAGLGAGDPEIHVGQLTNALLRDVRFLCAIGLHARGLSQEQCRQMFRTEAYQDEGNARQQAARGTYDPAYLNYTLGKLMIRRLREDWTASRGGRAGWKAFHDAFLSYGGPPIPLVREQMVGGAAKAVF